MLLPGHLRFEQGFQVTVDALTKPFLDAWDSDRPAEGTSLHAILEMAAAAAKNFDFVTAVAPQVDRYMAAVADGRSKLADHNDDATATDVIADIKKLLKVSVLVARVSHLCGGRRTSPSRITSTTRSCPTRRRSNP
jgi:hypothetical protein